MRRRELETSIFFSHLTFFPPAKPIFPRQYDAAGYAAGCPGVGAVPIGAACRVVAHRHPSRASHDARAPGHAASTPPPPAHAAFDLPRQMRTDTRLWGSSRPTRRPRARLPANRPARSARQNNRTSLGPRRARSRGCRGAGRAATMACPHQHPGCVRMTDAG